MKTSLLRLGAVLLVLGLSAPALRPAGWSARPGAGAITWTIEVTLSVTGQYRVTGRQGALSGDYAFTFLWKGSLEPDDVDWRLVHKSCELVDWKAQERPELRAAGEALTEGEVPEKPVFHFRYVLQDQDQVEFDFSTEGFPIPLNASTEKFQLILPSSAKTRRSGEALYDGLVNRGSNRVAIPADALGREPVDRTFDWGWAGNQSILGRDVTVVCRQTHQARLRLVLIPRAR